ncbi:alpha/beta fold hydrolase [Guggenheimella bovis]
MKEKIEVLSSDGLTTLHGYVWRAEGEWASLQIVHGMIEFIGRYETFAETLSKAGITVFGHDQLGHGESSEPNGFGHTGTMENLLQDIEIIRNLVSPKTPTILLGHSMGSFEARAMMRDRSYAGFIVMGTAFFDKSFVKTSLTMAKVLSRLMGGKKEAKLLTNMSLGSYNNGIKNPVTTVDWLTRDVEICKVYEKDPRNNFYFTNESYVELMRLLEHIHSDDSYEAIDLDKPVLIVSGTKDPVGDFGEGPTALFREYKKRGLKNVILEVFPEMRHEILNEIGKEEVYEAITRFIKRSLRMV